MVSSWHRLAALIVAVTLVSTTSGCLSIGGRVVHENPATDARLNSLEARVSGLEQQLNRPAITTH